MQGQITFVAAHRLGNFRADLLAGKIHRISAGRRAKGSARPRGRREIRIAQPDLDPVGGQAQHLGGKLAQDRIGAGADIGHVGFDNGMAVLDQGHARARFHQHVHPHRRSHAHADAPFAFHPLPHGLAGGPAEPLGTVAQSFGKLVAGKGAIRGGFDIGDVAQAQVHRVDANGFGQFVHSAFENGDAHRLAWRAHRSGGPAMNAGHGMNDLTMRRLIGKGRCLGDRFGKLAAGQGRYQDVVADAGQVAVGIAGQTDPLAGFGPAMGQIEYLLARHRDHHGPAQLLGGNGGCHGLGIDAQLGSEAAADIGGQQPHAAFPDSQGISHLLAVRRQHLQARPNGDAVPVPFGNGGMGLHGG